jgi:hypothetical protein
VAPPSPHASVREHGRLCRKCAWADPEGVRFEGPRCPAGHPAFFYRSANRVTTDPRATRGAAGFCTAQRYLTFKRTSRLGDVGAGYRRAGQRLPHWPARCPTARASPSGRARRWCAAGVWCPPAQFLGDGWPQRLTITAWQAAAEYADAASAHSRAAGAARAEAVEKVKVEAARGLREEAERDEVPPPRAHALPSPPTRATP